MKKITTVVLALLLAMSLSTTAFADDDISPKEINTLPGDASFTVKGSYVAGGTQVDTYRVDVSWGGMEFTYNNANGNTVTVKNHSSKAVNVEFAFDKAEGLDTASTFTGSFDKEGTVKLESAVGTAFDNAPNTVATLTLDGTLSEQYENQTDIELGKVTVTISEVA